MGKKKKVINPYDLSVEDKIDLSMERGEMREAMGWMFVKRLEKLGNELMAKPDCPDVFWIIYTVKWDDKSKKIREMWQVTDEKPKNVMMGQICYEIHKSGYAEFLALPFDQPIPESEFSDDYVWDNFEQTKNLPFSDLVYQN